MKILAPVPLESWACEEEPHFMFEHIFAICQENMTWNEIQKKKENHIVYICALALIHVMTNWR